jgi:hypothetical protein
VDELQEGSFDEEDKKNLKIPSQSQLPQALELWQPSQPVPMGKTVKASVNVLAEESDKVSSL